MRLIATLVFLLMACNGNSDSISPDGGSAGQTDGSNSGESDGGGASDDSCQYANDGECDEPEFCAVGTDETDCRGDGPTCFDGSQNGNEEGVDCGGTCNSCESPPLPGQNGGACLVDEDCPINNSNQNGVPNPITASECLTGVDFPGGYCLAPHVLGSCSETIDSGSLAMAFGRSDVCIDRCRTEAGCRDGYSCVETQSLTIGSVCLKEE